MVRGVGAALAVVAAAAVAAHAQAPDPGAFLKGQTVRFVVGYSPGGGYDSYARMLAPHFEKRTGATVVVENKPGGGGLTALNQLARSKPDGLSMMVLNGEAALISQLTKQAGVSYDITKIALLGRVAEEPHVMLVNPSLPGGLKEILASGRKVKFSAGNRLDNLADYASVLCEALKMNCQIVIGYKGSKEAGLAVMNGEVDALTTSESSAIDYSQGGRTRLIATIAQKRSRLNPDIPLVTEQVELPPEQKWWIDFRLGIKAFGRVVVGPPDLPADKLAHLQAVWREILNDQAVKAEGDRTQRPLDYLSPEALGTTVRDILQTLPADRLKEVNEVLLKKYS
jgi:tripartite-type tricarboxylate transporter receptor subunit TctC